MAKKKLRSPQEKKALSYAKDRRNRYGQNDKASRKLIPLRKARENRKIRRKVAQEISALPELDEATAEVVESSVRHDLHRLGGWRKCADVALGEAVERSKALRETRIGRRARAKADEDNPLALKRKAKIYRRSARWLLVSQKISTPMTRRREIADTLMEQAQAFEERADQILSKRSSKSD